MIISSVRARNVLKYARLELATLPEKGLIALSGPNESGKTAIVETVCFGLFGRTFSLPAEEIAKSIRWGETSSSVELEFTVEGNTRYRVSRSLAADGVHGATLTRVGEQTPMASGAAAVYDAVVALVGFNFQQYLDSLYLAQREISAPHSQSSTIKEVAGGARLERVAEVLAQDIRGEQAAIGNLDTQASAIREQINAMGIWEDGLSRLEMAKDALREKIARNLDSIEKLHGTTDTLQAGCVQLQEVGREMLEASSNASYARWQAYSDLYTKGLHEISQGCEALEPGEDLCEEEGMKSFVWELEGRLSAFDDVRRRTRELREDLGSRLGESGTAAPAGAEPPLPQQQAVVEGRLHKVRRWHFLARLNLLLISLITGAAWAGWFLLHENPHTDAASELGRWLEQNVSLWQPTYVPWLFYAAVGLSVLALLLAWRALRLGTRVWEVREAHAALGRRIEVARHRAELLDYMEGMAFPQALESLDELGDESLSKAIAAFADGPGEPFLSDEALAPMKQRLEELLQQCDKQLRDVREGVAAGIGGLEKENEQCQRDIAQNDEAIGREQERRRRAEEMNAAIAELKERIPDHEGRIRLLEMALRLVRGTCQELYSRFNRVLRRYTGEVMPLLTEDRYQHMQIDDDLAVRVFSREKNDFAGLDELSSGTQRQIMLAVRLAMAKALTEAAVAGRQFVILDEPFAFFDRERIRSTLKALPDIDQKMSQVWIISQEFESYEPFNLHLACSRDADEIVREGSA